MIASIREATLADYQTLMKLYGEFVTDPYRFLALDNDSFKRVLEDPNAYIDLAVVKNEIVGFISYSLRFVVRYPKPIIEVEEFFVPEKHRRKGIGRQLMNHVLKFATENAGQYVFIASAKERKEAHAFYKAMNFNEYAYHFRRNI